MASSWIYLTSFGASGGSGDVSGPVSSVDGEIALFDGVTGKLLKSATGTGFVKATSGVYSTAATVSLTTEVTGVLPVANGGTNSSAALNNNRFVVSSGGAIVENAAVTGNRALASDASGLPVASVTTDTELGFLSGVTSSVQTQLNTKVTGPAAATDNAITRYDGTTGKLVQNSGVTIDDTDNVIIPGNLSFSGTASFVRLPNLTTAQRDALTPTGGELVYNVDTDRPELYIAGTTNDWVDIAGFGAPVG